MAAAVKKNFVPLSKSHPQLAAQWHPTKNGNVSPEDVWANYSKSFWWDCEKGHEWDARIRNRAIDNYPCPYCSGKRVTRETSFAALYPEIAAEWHPTKNPGLFPYDFLPGSNEYVWWKCRKFGHEWKGRISNRALDKRGCRFCAGRRLAPENSLAARRQQIAAEWHPTLNGDQKPEQIRTTSTFDAWWLCQKCSHVWHSQVKSRSGRDYGCPKCNKKVFIPGSLPTLAEHSPELSAQWHPTKNGSVKPADVTVGSTFRATWICLRDPTHEWEATVNNRARKEHGCPQCYKLFREEKKRLDKRFPAIAAMWHPTKNASLQPHQISPASPQVVWWQCPKDQTHVWELSVQNQVKNRKKCPYCARQKITRETSFGGLHPDLLAEWDFQRNLNIDPFSISPGVHTKVSWRCRANPGHVWEAQIKNRVLRKTGCPLCRVGWTVSAIRGFVDSLKHHLSTFTPAELFVLFQQNGLLIGDRKGQAFLDALATGRFPFAEIEKFCKGQKSLVDSFLADSTLTLEALSETKPETTKENELGVVGEGQEESAELPTAETADVLKSLQSPVVVSADQEAIDFLVASALAKIWKHGFRDEVAAVTQARDFMGDAYAERVRTEFLAEYERVKSLEIPAGYAFTVEGKLASPNLMQRLVAARIQHKRREGNWSGTGPRARRFRRCWRAAWPARSSR